MDQFQGIGTGEGWGTGKQLIERGTQGIKVGAIVDDAIDPTGLLRRYVGQGARQLCQWFAVGMLPRDERSKAEIDEMHGKWIGRKDDVTGIQITMDYAFIVDRLHRPGYFNGDVQPLIEAQITQLDCPAHGFATEIFKDDAWLAIVHRECATDVRTGQRLIEIEFVVIAGNGVRRLRVRLQRFGDDGLFLPHRSADQG